MKLRGYRTSLAVVLVVVVLAVAFPRTAHEYGGRVLDAVLDGADRLGSDLAYRLTMLLGAR